VYEFPKLPRALAVNDPDLQDAELAALLQVPRHQRFDFLGLEQVQVERAVYGPWRSFFVKCLVFWVLIAHGVLTVP